MLDPIALHPNTLESRRECRGEMVADGGILHLHGDVLQSVEVGQDSFDIYVRSLWEAKH